MPIYEEEGRLTREDLLDLCKRNKCKECGARLDVFWDMEKHKAFLACTDWRRTQHAGIEREVSRYEKEGLASFNIETRREILEQNYGPGMTTALERARLPTTGALTKSQAMDILKLVYPNVPESEIIRTAILCRDFGLHPLMKEVYIIGFKNSKTGKTDYSIVIGITASRKMAADKKGSYSFLDDCPRTASPEEVIKQFGKNSEEERDNLISICKLKGEKGNEALGFGLYPKNKAPYGTDKGNTQRNMANIRSERQGLDRLPGEAIPLRNFEVIDETYALVPDVGKVDTETGEVIEGEHTEVSEESIEGAPTLQSEAKKEHWCREHNCPYAKKTRGSSTWWAHKLEDGNWCNEAKKKEAQPAPAAEAEEPQSQQRDPATILTINDLYKACNEDWNLQPAEVISELGFGSQIDINISPADCYRQLAAVR